MKYSCHRIDYKITDRITKIKLIIHLINYNNRCKHCCNSKIWDIKWI